MPACCSGSAGRAWRIGWNVWGLGIAAGCCCLFYFVVHRVQHPHGSARAVCCAGAFVVLLVLGQFGSVGLAGNSYPGPLYLLAASLAGWMLVCRVPTCWRACPR